LRHRVQVDGSGCRKEVRRKLEEWGRKLEGSEGKSREVEGKEDFGLERSL